MVLPGIVRRINKNLPNLLQVILFICLIHYLGQGVMLKIQRKLQLGRNARFSPTTAVGKDAKKSKPSFKKINHKFEKNLPSAAITTTTTPPPPRPPYHVTKAIIDQRIQTLHSACKKWNLGSFSAEGIKLSEEDTKEVSLLPRTPLYQALLVSEKRQISYCPVIHAGSNWIGKRLLELSGQYTVDEVAHLRQPANLLARQQYPYLTSWERYAVVLTHSVNFLVVRHPFDRLLASYKHLLENAERDSHNFLKYGRRIVRTYRKFPGGGKEPSFGEFISFVIERDVRYLDDAWQPIARRCTPCHVPYTVIMHFETLWNDTFWTWDHANLPKINTTDYISYSITPEIRRKYFTEITIHQLAKLHHKYRLDFDLFGYKLDEHLMYAQPGDEPLTSDILNALPLAKRKASSESSKPKIDNIVIPSESPDNLADNKDSSHIKDSPIAENPVEDGQNEIDDKHENEIKDLLDHPEAVAPFIPN